LLASCRTNRASRVSAWSADDVARSSAGEEEARAPVTTAPRQPLLFRARTVAGRRESLPPGACARAADATAVNETGEVEGPPRRGLLGLVQRLRLPAPRRPSRPSGLERAPGRLTTSWLRYVEERLAATHRLRAASRLHGRRQDEVDERHVSGEGARRPLQDLAAAHCPGGVLSRPCGPGARPLGPARALAQLEEALRRRA